MGYEWEKSAYNEKEIRRFSGKKNIPGTYVWRFPSVVILKEDYAGTMIIRESRKEKVDNWMRTLIKIGEDLGLRVRGSTQGEVEMILRGT